MRPARQARWTPSFNVASVPSPPTRIAARGCGDDIPAASWRAEPWRPQETVPIHGDGVLVPQIADAPGVGAAGRDLANPIVSKTRWTWGNGSTPSEAASIARASISFVPPPAGMRPTPTSTRPMYVSASACTRAACRAISQPPPSVRPPGATTTGTPACAPGRALKRANHQIDFVPIPSCASSRSSIRLAPAEKFARIVADDECAKFSAASLRRPAASGSCRRRWRSSWSGIRRTAHRRRGRPGSPQRSASAPAPRQAAWPATCRGRRPFQRGQNGQRADVPAETPSHHAIDIVW